LSVYVTGLHNTLQDLLTEHVAKKSHCWPLTSAIKPAASNISVFIGLKGSPKELGLTAQNVWMYSGSNTEEVRVWAFAFLLILSNHVNFHSHFTTLWILNLPKNYFRNLTQLFSFHPEQQKTLRMRNGIQLYSFFGNTFILIRNIYFQACHNFFRSQCNISFDVYPIFMVLPVVRDDSKEARRWVQCFKTRNWSKNHWPGGSSFPQTQSKNESFSRNQTNILDFFHIFFFFRIISTTTVWGLRWLSDIS
jgi:hypothetical protein